MYKSHICPCFMFIQVLCEFFIQLLTIFFSTSSLVHADIDKVHIIYMNHLGKVA